MADIPALRDELLNDPLGRGYAGMTDQQAADSLNAQDRVLNRSSISGDEAFQATEPAAFAALDDGGGNSPDVKNQWLSFCGRDSIDPFASANVQFVIQVFGAGSTTVTNLQALRTFTTSRAEELNLLGNSTEIGPAHVAQARA